MMRRLVLAAAVAAASLTASCSVAPPMKAYTYPKYGFTADFQAPPKVEDNTDPQSGVNIVSVSAQGAGHDFSISISRVDPARDIDGLVEQASSAQAKFVGGEVTERTYCATAEGVLGRELVITKDGRPAYRLRYFLSNARFYILTAEAAEDDPAVKDFMTSFHVIPAQS